MRAVRVAVVLVAAAFLLGLTSCGGDDDDESAGTTPAATDGGGGGGEADGAAVFASAGCGGCHMLEAAGSSGTAGPNLDDLQPSMEEVEEQVRNGGGGMPAFGDELSDAEIEAVATYVSESAGG